MPVYILTQSDEITNEPSMLYRATISFSPSQATTSFNPSQAFSQQQFLLTLRSTPKRYSNDGTGTELRNTALRRCRAVRHPNTHAESRIYYETVFIFTSVP